MMLVVILHWPLGTEIEPWSLELPPFPLSRWTLFLQGSISGGFLQAQFIPCKLSAMQQTCILGTCASVLFVCLFLMEVKFTHTT